MSELSDNIFLYVILGNVYPDLRLDPKKVENEYDTEACHKVNAHE